MELTPLEIQVLRDTILEAAQKFPRGITTTMLAATIKAMQFDLPERGADSLEAHILHLESAKLIIKVEKPHTPSAEAWKITKEGDDYLRSR